MLITILVAQVLLCSAYTFSECFLFQMLRVFTDVSLAHFDVNLNEKLFNLSVSFTLTQTICHSLTFTAAQVQQLLVEHLSQKGEPFRISKGNRSLLMILFLFHSLVHSFVHSFLQAHPTPFVLCFLSLFLSLKRTR